MDTEARWQVRWKPGRAAIGRSQISFSPLVSRGKSCAQRAPERLKAYVDRQVNNCEAEQALAAPGFVEVMIAKAPSSGETLESWAERWALTRPRVTARSKHDYLPILRTHILPALATYRLSTSAGPTLRPG